MRVPCPVRTGRERTKIASSQHSGKDKLVRRDRHSVVVTSPSTLHKKAKIWLVGWVQHVDHNLVEDIHGPAGHKSRSREKGIDCSAPPGEAVVLGLALLLNKAERVCKPLEALLETLASEPARRLHPPPTRTRTRTRTYTCNSIRARTRHARV